jgi:RNA ligase (TIGR02306 family)
MSVLPTEKKYKEGQDVTDLLGVKHYDPESPTHVEPNIPQNKYLKFIMKFLFKFWIFRVILLPFMRKERGAWPEGFSKTDEERIQGEPSLLEKFKDFIFFITEKLDGQSATFFYKKKLKFGVCSRNNWLKTPDDSNWWKMARKYKMEEILTKYFKENKIELSIQGESVGPGIQKNKYDLKEVELFVFNIIDITNKKHFTLPQMEEFCKVNGLTFVPVLDREFKLPATVAEMVALADGNATLKKRNREGIVVRHISDEGKKISFKAISNKFLLEHEE